MDEPRIDESLWVRIDDDCSGKHYLLGNPHTSPGRVFAWCPEKKVEFNISVCEVREGSAEAVAWLRGFLAGNEPPPPSMEFTDDTPEYQFWRDSCLLFQRTGYWYGEGRTCEQCGTPLLSSWPDWSCKDCTDVEVTPWIGWRPLLWGDAE